MFKHSPERLSVSLLEAAVLIASFAPIVVEITPAPVSAVAPAVRSSSHRSIEGLVSNSAELSDDDDNTVASAILEELDDLRQQVNDFQKQTDADQLRIQQLTAEVRTDILVFCWAVLLSLMSLRLYYVCF